MSNIYFQMSHGIIDSSYNQAIMNYNSQKINFMKQLNISNDKALEEWMEKLNEKIYSEVVEEELDKKFTEIYSNVEKWVKQAIEGDMSGVAEVKKRLKQLEDNQQAKEENYHKNIKAEVEAFLVSNNIEKSEFVNMIIGEESLGSNIDIQNSLLGYARRVFVNEMTDAKIEMKMQKYKTSLKGFYQEELITSALSEMLEGTAMAARQSGSITNSQNYQIQYDIILGSSNINKMGDLELGKSIEWLDNLNKTYTGRVNSELISGGIQSKSWTAPFEQTRKENPNTRMTFGRHAQYLPQGGRESHWWHAGMYQIMTHLQEVIGVNNFMFATGNHIYWTSELLNSLRDQDYVLAFYQAVDGKLTPSVLASIHEDK